MANNQNFSNLLLENIDNEILIAFEVITSSKDVTETTGRPALSESSMNHSLINLTERYTYHLEEQVLFCKRN